MWRLKQKIHSSWLLAIASTLFVAGVAFSLVINVYWWVGIGCFVGILVCFYVRAVYMVPVLVFTSLLFGMGYGSAHLGAREVYAVWIGKTVHLEGRVKEDLSKTSSGATSLQLDTIKLNTQPTLGSVYVSIRGSPEAKRGDIVTVTGEAKPGFGNFPISISATKLDSVIRPVPGDVGRMVRDWFAERVRVLIGEPQASLGIGFLTGQKSALPEDLADALKVAGLTHIVVASGYNLTILVRLARRLFVKVSKFLSAVSSGVMITMFMAITGLSPSMTRAGLVSGISLLAWYYGHRLHPFVLLPFAAAVTIAINPSYAWGDLGWQLSFSAFVGVMIVGPLLQRYFFGEKEPGVLRQILGETVAAHLVTIPIIALSFGTISHVAIIANVLVVPLVPLAMLLTFICGLWSIVGLAFGYLIALPTTWLLGYMVQVATFVSELSWAQSELTLSGWVWLGYVMLLVGICIWMWKVTKFDFSGANPIL